MDGATILFKCRWLLLFLWIAAALPASGKIIYVDDDAIGANNGSSWQNAYKYLQDALADANAAEKPVEIRVAQGIYKPDRGAGITAGNRAASFQLINGVTLSGGYAGLSMPDPNIRDITKYETILSGDLAGNDIDVNKIEDLVTEPTRMENSYHVAMSTDVDETSELKGFTITAGNANGEPYYHINGQGGGIYNSQSSPTIRNCKFTGNSAYNGGGIYNYERSNTKITNCIINGNMADNYGGGLYIDGCNPILIDCILDENVAGGNGGGIYDFMSIVIFTNCTFNENKAGSNGGGISSGGMITPYWNSKAILKFENCTFRKNSANSHGGGIYNSGSDSTFINCEFIENSASAGGGTYNDNSDSILIQNTFKKNFAENGGGIWNYSGSDLDLTCCIFSGNSANIGSVISNYGKALINQSTFSGNLTGDNTGVTQNNRGGSLNIHNCIIRGNISVDYYSDIMINYSDIENKWLGYGKGNIDTDPLFADPNNGDYHLKSQAGRFDPNTQSWVQDDVTSPCIDAGDPNSPIGYEPFPNGGYINMGAYGGTAEASKSYFGKPVCQTIVAGDINGDCKVDLADLEILMRHWLTCNDPSCQIQVTNVKIYRCEHVNGSYYQNIEEVNQLKVGDIFRILVEVTNYGSESVNLVTLYEWDFAPNGYIDVIGYPSGCLGYGEVKPQKSMWLGPLCGSQAFKAKESGPILMNINVKDIILPGIRARV
jgi:predicted outer membrane repeat protein